MRRWPHLRGMTRTRLVGPAVPALRQAFSEHVLRRVSGPQEPSEPASALRLPEILRFALDDKGAAVARVAALDALREEVLGYGTKAFFGFVLSNRKFATVVDRSIVVQRKKIGRFGFVRRKQRAVCRRSLGRHGNSEVLTVGSGSFRQNARRNFQQRPRVSLEIGSWSVLWVRSAKEQTCCRDGSLDRDLKRGKLINILGSFGLPKNPVDHYTKAASGISALWLTL